MGEPDIGTAASEGPEPAPGRFTWPCPGGMLGCTVAGRWGHESCGGTAERLGWAEECGVGPAARPANSTRWAAPTT